MDSLFNSSWQLKELQMVNWGPYTGSWILSPATGWEARGGRGGGMTAIGGKSGAGKSAILDALTVLTQSRSRKLNKASGGEASDRTAASYVLGYLKRQRRENGKTLYLRRSRDDEAAWGALKASFANSEGGRVTLAQFFYVPGGESRSCETVYAVNRADFNAEDARQRADRRFTPKTLKEAIPALEAPTKERGQYRRSLQQTLGTNRNYDDLSYMMTSAKLDEDFETLVKTTVFRVPGTIEKAREVVERADGHKKKNDDAIGKAEMRKRLIEIEEEYAEFRKKRDECVSYGSWTEPQQSDSDKEAHKIWWDEKTLRYLHAHKAVVAKAVEAVTEELEESERSVKVADKRYEDARADYSNAGGDRLTMKKNELEAAERRLRWAKTKHDLLEPEFESSGIRFPEDSERQWNELKEGLKNLSEAYNSREAKEERRSQETRASEELRHAKEKTEEAKRRLELAERGTRIDGRMERSQRTAAAATGIPVSELPYLAELIDIDGEENEKWRTALNAALGKEADAILVTADEHDFRKALEHKDQAEFGRRTTFRYIKASDLSSPPSAAAKPGWLSSVVKVKEGSPLANWVKRHISSEGIDFKLVEDGDFNPSDLRQVSMKGQVKIGNKGYYGHGRQASDFIGFADKRYLTERRREHGEALMAEKEALESLGRIRAEQEAEGRKAGLYDTLKTVEWDEVACAAVEIEIERLKTEINGLEKSNLSQLERRMEAAKEGHDKEVRANQDLKRRQKENEESEKELNAKISSIEGSLTMHRILPTVQEPLLELFERSLDHVFGLNCPTESQRGASIIESGYNDLLKKSENEIVDSLKHKAMT